MKRALAILLLIFLFASSVAGETRVTDVNPSVVAPGESFTAEVTLDNTGDDSSYFKELVLETPEEFTVIEGLNLGGNELCDYCKDEDTVRVKAEETINSGSYSFEVRPDPSSDTGYGSSDSFQIVVDGRPDLLLKIRNSTVSQEGEDSVDLAVENLGSETAYQISGSLDIPGIERDPNNFALGSLEPGEKVVREIGVRSSDDVRPGVKSAALSFSYRHGSEILSVSDEASIKVLKDPELAVSNLQPEDPVIGESNRLLVEMENVGNGEAKSITSNLNCDNASLDRNKAFVGSLENSESVPAVYQVNPDTSVVDCELAVNYVGANQSSVEESFSFVASERDRGDVFVLGGSLFLAVLVALVWKKKFS